MDKGTETQLTMGIPASNQLVKAGQLSPFRIVQRKFSLSLARVSVNSEVKLTLLT